MLYILYYIFYYMKYYTSECKCVYVTYIYISTNFELFCNSFLS